jgi:hypothetical protein
LSTLLELDGMYRQNKMLAAHALSFEAEDRCGGAIGKAYAQIASKHDDAERQGANERIEAIVGGAFHFAIRRSAVNLTSRLSVAPQQKTTGDPQHKAAYGNQLRFQTLSS